MQTPANPNSVKKGSAVKLITTLPANRNFGNTLEIVSPNSYGQLRAGFVTSEGFEQGMLRVTFDLHPEGRQRVQFNLLSAKEYLVTDIY